MSSDAKVFVKQPPLDGVLDSYYKVDEHMDLQKLKRIKNVMKSAISITKSKTGEVILKTNRIEAAGLNRRLNIIKKERTFAEVDLNKDKIVFKAQYKKWMDYRKAAPSDIQVVIDRYKRIKSEVKQRQVSKSFGDGGYRTRTPKWGTKPFSSIINMTGSEDTLTRSEEIEEVYTRAKCGTPQENYPYSEPRRELASRENLSRQSRQRAAIWREKTFDMKSIRDLLTDQVNLCLHLVC